jgi:hypothetical protein
VKEAGPDLSPFVSNTAECGDSANNLHSMGADPGPRAISVAPTRAFRFPLGLYTWCGCAIWMIGGATRGPEGGSGSGKGMEVPALATGIWAVARRAPPGPITVAVTIPAASGT